MVRDRHDGSPWSDLRPYQLRGWFHRCADHVASRSDRSFAALLVAVHVAVSALVLWVAARLPLDRLDSSDVPLFDERAAAILAGDLIGRGASVAPDTPPLVNFLFLVPHLMGGGLLAYGLYFSTWVLAAALALFLGLRKMDAGAARGAALLVVTHPFAWGTSLLMVQDEAIVAALVVFAFVAALRAAQGLAGAWTGLGSLVKAWPGVGAPILLLAADGGRAKRRLIAGGVVAVGLPLLPFLFFEPSHLMHVLGFYGSGVRPDRTTPSGVSFWKFLDEATGAVVEPLLVGVLLVVSAALWWLVARRSVSLSKAYPLGFLLFFVLYPKLHYGYYLILVVVLAPWLARRPLATLATFVLAGLTAVAHLSWYRLLPLPWMRDVGVPLVLSAAALAIVVMLGLLLVRWDERTVPVVQRSVLASGLGASLLGVASVLAVASVVLLAVPLLP